MAGEIFNANPTVYTPSKPYTRKSDLGNPNSLWMGGDERENDDSDEVEPIDQDEVFGATIHSMPIVA